MINPSSQDTFSRLYRLFMEAPALIGILKGREGRVEFFNPQFSRLWGHRPVIGKLMREAWPELAGQGYFEMVEQVFDTGESIYGKEFPAQIDRDNNGVLAQVYFNFVYQATHNESGQIDGVAIYGVDVTEQVVGRQQAEQTTANLKLALEAGHMGTWQLNLITSQISHSPEYAHIFGATAPLPAWTFALFLQHITEEDREYARAAFQAALIFGELTLEARINRLNGHTCWIYLRGQVSYTHEQPVAINGIIIDITERKQAEERLYLLQNLTAALSEALTLEQVAEAALRQIAQTWDNNTSAIYLLNPERTRLELIKQVGYTSELNLNYSEVTLDTHIPMIDAVRTGQVIWLEGQHEIEHDYPHLTAITRRNQINAILCFPFLVKGQSSGGLYMGFNYPRPRTIQDAELLLAMAQQCALAFERARLHQQAQQLAADQERQRLARDLHDAVSQTLFSATVTAEALPRLFDKNPQKTLERLQEVVILNRAAMAEMRTLLLELRPEAILNNNLSLLLQHLLEAARGRRRVRTQLTIDAEAGTLPPEVHIACYRIAQEAIHNMMKHSGATAITVSLHSLPDQVRLILEDNGCGFDPTISAGGIGLNTMRERAALVQATLQVKSEIGQGTAITLQWPTVTVAK